MTTLEIYAEPVEAQEVKNSFSWDVLEKSIYLKNGTLLSDHKAIVRSDNGNVLNVCKKSYTPTTNEQFTEFVHKLSETTGYEIQNFNEFQEGRKVLAFLSAPQTSLNGWNFNNYLAVGNAHDSSLAFFVANTTVMIRCQNQFSKLYNNSMKAFHTTGNANQIRQIERSINQYGHQQRELMQNFEVLNSREYDAKRIDLFISHMFDLNSAATWRHRLSEVSTRKENQITDLLTAINIEKKELGETDLALFNGVTRWTTHTRTQKEKTFGNLFGTNSDLNTKALTWLLN